MKDIVSQIKENLEIYKKYMDKEDFEAYRKNIKKSSQELCDTFVISFNRLNEISSTVESLSHIFHDEDIKDNEKEATYNAFHGMVDIFIKEYIALQPLLLVLLSPKYQEVFHDFDQAINILMSNNDLTPIQKEKFKLMAIFYPSTSDQPADVQSQVVENLRKLKEG